MTDDEKAQAVLEMLARRYCPRCHRHLSLVLMGELTRRPAWMCGRTDCEVLFVGEDNTLFWAAPELK